MFAFGTSCLEFPPEHRSVHTSALAYCASRLLLEGCVTASPQTTLQDISSHSNTSNEISERLVKPLTAEAFPV